MTKQQFLDKKLSQTKFYRKYKHITRYLDDAYGPCEIRDDIFNLWLTSHFLGYNVFQAEKQFWQLTRSSDNLFGSTSTNYRKLAVLRNAKTYGGTFSKYDVLKEMVYHNNNRNLHFTRACESNRSHDVETYFPTKKHGGRMVGIEIECIIPVDKINAKSEVKHNREEQSTYSYIANYIFQWTKKEKVRYINVTTDGSITGVHENKEMGFEFRVLVDLDKGYDNLYKFCNFLNSVGARVNASCGLHVHFDQRHLLNKPEEVLRRANRLNNALFGLRFIVPKSRTENSQYSRLEPNFARSLQMYIEEKKLNREYYNFPNGNRYSAINTTCLDNKGTIEVRLHSGTVSFKKIKNWIEICYNIMNNPNFDHKTFEGQELQRLQPTEELNDVFIQFLNFPEEQEELKYYIKDRFYTLKYINNEGSEDEKRISLIPTELAISTINRIRSESQQRETERQRENEREMERARVSRELERSQSQTLYQSTFNWEPMTVSFDPEVRRSEARYRNSLNGYFANGAVRLSEFGSQLNPEPPIVSPTEAVEPEDNSLLGRMRRLANRNRNVFDIENRE